MKLINRYVTAVGKHLPRSKRADIEAELRSTLLDMLEDRASKAGRPTDEQMSTELLKEYGAPEKVAATYQQTQYLIGPRLFPTFMIILKIVFSVLSVMALVGLGVTLGKSGLAGPQFAAALGKTLLGYLGGAISAFGNIVLVFAILERVLPASEIDALKMTDEWDPASLSLEPDPDQIKPAEIIFEIITTVAGLVIFNLYPNLIGFHFLVDGAWISIPALSGAFFGYLSWINLLGLLEIGLAFYLLRKQVLQSASRVARIILEALTIALLALMLRGPSLLALTAESFNNTPIGAETGAILMRVFLPVVPLILIIIMIVTGIEIAKQAFQLFKINFKTK